jgi:uncharacterized Zn-finger protein
MPHLKRRAHTTTRHFVTPENLPLCCPLPGVPVWNLHPRVYLAIEATGEVRCPYCSTLFVLQPVQPGPHEALGSAGV